LYVVRPSSPSFESDVVLRDGSTIHLRPVRPDETGTLRFLREQVARGGSHARWTDIPADPARGFILVGEGGGEVQAVGGYATDAAQPGRAEVGFAIATPLQGRGLGTRMLEVLAKIAWQQQVRVFDAWVGSESEPVMRMLLDSGFEIQRRMDGGTYHVTLSLAHTDTYLERAAERSEIAATASMRAFFEPRSVAVIGASRERGKIGAEVLHNLIEDGYTGTLFAVHPAAASIDGVPAFPRVTDIPGDVDLAVICVPARLVQAIADDCIAKGVKALVVITAGFAETGTAGRASEMDLLARVRHAGIRMVGPNCMGVLNTDPAIRLNATFSPVSPPTGSVAMSTQSGALGLAILDYARGLNIGLSTFVSVGNKADVSSNDLIQYWASDPRTQVILLYVESFGNPRKFSQIARRVGRRKPIVAVKSGRSAAGARAASSHTGAMASRDAIVDALFRQAGVIRTDTIEELFDVAMLFSSQPVPKGRRVAILTNAGGPGILAADACEARGLELPALSEASVTALRSMLAAEASVANPVDMIASASPEQYEHALTTVLSDDRVDSALVIFIPPLVTRAEDVAAAVKRATAARPGKPVLAIFMSAQGASPMLAPIPCFRFPEAAAVALARATTYGEWLAAPADAPVELDDIDRDAARTVIDEALARGGGWLLPAESRTLLSALRIAMPAEATVSSEDEAVAAADRIGYPVVLKAVGERIVHKTELGAVVMGLEHAAAVRAAWRDLASRLAGLMTGGLVQEFVTGGVEMLAGAVEDATFGPVIACATGGTRAELFADSQFRLHPLTERDAAAMVEGLRGAALLRGFRGAPKADEAALRDSLLRLSALAGLCPEVQELDINPLVVLPKGVRAVDTRIRVDRPRPPAASRRISY